MPGPIYLDYAATTPVDPKVADAMSACLTMDGVFANPASRSHFFGWQAEEQVELARRKVAELLHCDPREVVWTSGATESNNLALKGVFEASAEVSASGVRYTGHLITSSIEHKAVVDPARWLEARGVAVTWLEPNAAGVISLQQVRDALRPDTKLVSLMQVNNEVGTINPIADIGHFCREHKVLLHVDAAQAAGKVDIDVAALNADLVSLSAHKFYGPKGVGALYVRRLIKDQVAPLIHGGGHERGLRSGTLPTHQLVGMGAAAEMALAGLGGAIQQVAKLRDLLWNGIADLPGIKRNGASDGVSPVHLNVCFSGVEGETLLLSLRELAVSSGSACNSASTTPSYVLKAMGLSDADAESSIRFSLGRYTQVEDIERAIEHIRKTVSQLLSV